MTAKRRGRTSIPLVERAVGLISLTIVVATISYLLVEAVRGGENVAVLTVTVDGIQERDGSFVLDVVVRNRGRGAAADVHLAGVAGLEHEQQHRAEARLNYVPGFSTRRASLVFAAHPGPDLQVGITGYAVP